MGLEENVQQLMLFLIYLFTSFNKTHKIWSHAVHLIEKHLNQMTTPLWK